MITRPDVRSDGTPDFCSPAPCSSSALARRRSLRGVVRELLQARERVAEMRRALEVAETEATRLVVGDAAGRVAGCITGMSADFRRLRASYDSLDQAIELGLEAALASLQQAGLLAPPARN